MVMITYGVVAKGEVWDFRENFLKSLCEGSLGEKRRAGRAAEAA